MVFQPINDIATICALRGIYHAVISPGSRNAPLTLAFARHPQLKTKVIPDERSAGFIALGMALKLRKPVVLICTSGTAVLNLGPAIAEAYFQNVPLLIFTADRPPELIGQQDGQTIFQENVYGKHVKKSFSFDADYNRPQAIEEVKDKVLEALLLAEEYPQGPVHVNVPFREPFYPIDGEKFQFSQNLDLPEINSPVFNLSEDEWQYLISEWNSSSKIMILGGQFVPDDKLKRNLLAIGKDVVVAGDIISNLHGSSNTFNRLDIIPGNKDDEFLKQLQPDLLISYGNSTISKNLKSFFRKFRPHHHWHIQPAGEVADTYQSITKIVRTTPDVFFEKIKSWEAKHPNGLLSPWMQAEKVADDIMHSILSQNSFNELGALAKILNKLPKKTELHLANSLSVRLANFIGLQPGRDDITIYSNRGTSGIDGSNSTAMGMSLVSENPVVLVTGDMAFFYDRNAFWHKYNPSNLFIIILNNHAGGIFGVIDGPSEQPELKEFFETEQKLTAGYTAAEFQMDYFCADSYDSLDKAVNKFFEQTGRAKILEVETDLSFIKKVFKDLKSAINKINL